MRNDSSKAALTKPPRIQGQASPDRAELRMGQDQARRGWGAFWAGARPGDRVRLDQSGAFHIRPGDNGKPRRKRGCWNGEPPTIDPKGWREQLLELKARGLPMPPAAPVGKRLPGEPRDFSFSLPNEDHP